MKYNAMTALGIAMMIGACGNPGSQSELDLTNADTSTEYKSVVAFKVDNGYCSGTKISPNHILTAAHCVPTLKAGQKIAVTNLPSRKVTDTSQWFSGVLHTVHVAPSWDAQCRDQSLEGCWSGFNPIQNPISDIAILQFESLPTAWTAAKVDLAPVQSGESITIVGYGCDETSSVSFPNILKRRKHTPSVTVPEANTTTDSRYVFTAGIGEGGGFNLANASLCSGDSGGPIIRRSSNAVVGVNSWSEEDERFNAHARFSSPNGSNLLLESWLRSILPRASLK